MRWKLNIKPGEDTIETWFAWFPVTINTETRWLEKVEIVGYWKKVKSIFLTTTYEFIWLRFNN